MYIYIIYLDMTANMCCKSSNNNFYKCKYKCSLWAYFNSIEIFELVLLYCLFSKPSDI